MSKPIRQRSLYTTKHNHIGEDIYEYDMIKANISILRYLGKIDDDKYTELLNKSRHDRMIYIGLLLRNDKELKVLFHKTLRDMVIRFIEVNGIKDNDIISIKNDAIFITGAYKIQLDVGVKFALKNIYDSFIRLPRNIEIYKQSNTVVVKGVKHKNESIERLIVKVIKLIENGEYYKYLLFIKKIREKYISLSLHRDFYRTYNSQNVWIYKNSRDISIDFSIPCEDLNDIDITYNYINVIVPLANLAQP